MPFQSFIASHPFPSYEEVIRIIEGHPDPALSMAMYAEYGRPHHEALKKAYEAGMSREAIRKAGEAIYALGGMQAMQMNYYAFAAASPFRFANDFETYYGYQHLQYGWDGVGDWMA